mmetsp:Transcript_50437/g.119939  ORF Transcript_50437/g.119939 Transcript_50437/m.119939 type:complete len:986 (+) Transcript_50437:78-3035(+)
MAPKSRKAPAPAPAADEDYGSWSVAKLQAKCKELGVAASGKKSDLVERLQELGQTEAPAKAAAKRAPPKAAAEEPPAKRAKAASGAVAAPPPAKAKAGGRKPPEEESPPEPKAKGRAKPEPKAPPPKAKGRGPPPAAEEAEEPKAKARGKAPAKASSSSQAASSSSQAPALQAASQNHFEDGEFKAEYAKSSRSRCRRCNDLIMEGQMRLGKMVPSDKFDGMTPVWHHAKCFLEGGILPKFIGLISGFSSLRAEDQKMITAIVPTVPQDGAGEAPSGVDKKKMEAQNKKFTEIKDALQKLSDAELKEMLALNDYPDVNLGKMGINATKQDLCADGILFGKTMRCTVCADEASGKEGGRILLAGEGYKCVGFVSEFLRCTNKTQTPERELWELTSAAKAVMPRGVKPTKGTRLFYGKLRDEDAAVQSSDSSRPPLLGLAIVIHCSDSKELDELQKMITDNGGQVMESVSKATSCVISTQDAVDEEDEGVQTAKDLNVPGVTEDFIVEAIKPGAQVEMADYLLWGEVKRRVKEAAIAKFKEKNGLAIDVDVGTDILSKAHILVEKGQNRIYSESLNATDMVTGHNSFYTLYLLESDSSPSEYWVFRKWGRIGVSQGGKKLEPFGSNKLKAISEFSKVYLDKTGNNFGHKRDDFVAKPGKFQRVDVAHKSLSGKQGESSGGDAEGDGAGAMGQQLSKAQIEKADKVLDELEGIIKEAPSPAQKAKILGASAKYYNLIPHNFGMKKPPPIDNEEILGAEKALLQFYLRMGFEDIGGEDEEKLAPIAGVMELPLPKTLLEACTGVCKAADVKSCVTKGTTMFKKKAGKPVKPMSAEMYAAILMYTGNAIYKDLNKALRDEDRDKVRKYFPYLRMLFEACGSLPVENTTLWRGISVDLLDQYKVGSTITWWGVSSCTSAQKVAQDFANSCGDKSTLLTVETKTACNISQVSFYANESESILLPGTQLEVVESKRVGKQAHIKLREVGRCVQ